MIAWKYLDKKAATIEAIKDYAAMEFIILNYERVKSELQEDMTAVRSSAPTGMPRSQNPGAGEAWLAGQIDKQDMFDARYRDATEFMRWYKPGWAELSDDERYILTEFFLGEDVRKTDAIQNIGERLFIERSHVYRRKERALNHLALLLYGK